MPHPCKECNEGTPSFSLFPPPEEGGTGAVRELLAHATKGSVELPFVKSPFQSIPINSAANNFDRCSVEEAAAEVVAAAVLAVAVVVAEEEQ